MVHVVVVVVGAGVSALFFLVAAPTLWLRAVAASFGVVSLLVETGSIIILLKGERRAQS